MADRLWVIDQIGPVTAALETGSGQLVTVRRSLLPADAREGMVVRVTRRDAGTLVLALDAAATAAARQRSAGVAPHLHEHDPGDR